MTRIVPIGGHDRITANPARLEGWQMVTGDKTTEKGTSNCQNFASDATRGMA